MLRNWFLLAFILISNNVYAQLDAEFLSNELFNITNHGLKQNVYTLHLAANDFGTMKPSELNINLKNIDKLLSNKKIVENLSSEQIDEVEKNFNQIVQSIYENKDPEVNQAVTFNLPMGDFVFALIAVPNVYYEEYDECAGAFILFQSYTCFQLDYNTKSFLSKYIKRNHVPSLDSDYLGNFIVVHEYAHTLPEQLRLNLSEFFKNIKNPKIKRDVMLVYHFNEVYSDLYASIRLLQKGYPLKDLDQIIFMRNVSLFLSKDVIHFSTPYIKNLKGMNKDEYMSAKSIEDIDKLIKKIFYNVINEVDTMNEKNFFSEKLEVRDALTDIASFAFNINKNIDDNTFQRKTPEQSRFVSKLFNNFVSSIYYANRRFSLDYSEKDY